jgi:hypothetical protein
LHLWLELGSAVRNGWNWAWLSWMAGDGPACKDGWKWALLARMAAVKPGFHGWLEVCAAFKDVCRPWRWASMHGWLKKGAACMDVWRRA